MMNFEQKFTSDCYTCPQAFFVKSTFWKLLHLAINVTIFESAFISKQFVDISPIISASSEPLSLILITRPKLRTRLHLLPFSSEFHTSLSKNYFIADFVIPSDIHYGG